MDTLWYDKDSSSPSDRDTAKSELGITDTLEDGVIDDYGLKANRKIDNLIFGLLDNIPTVIAAEITQELKQAAILNIARRYKITHKNFEAAKEYESDFKVIIESVKIRAKAEHTPRTRIVARSVDYDTESELFSQTLR